MKQMYLVNNSQGLIRTLSGLKSRITPTRPLLNHYCTLTVALLLLLGGFSTRAWGAGNKWTVKVGIGTSSVGRGSAVAQIYSDAVVGYGVKATTPTATTTSLQENSWKSDLTTTKAHCIYTATAYAGYHFVAWYTNAECNSGEKTGSTYTGTSEGGGPNTHWEWVGIVYTKVPDATDITYKYYAKFEPNTYTVNFNKNAADATLGTTSKTVTYDAQYGAGTGGWPTPTRTGYTFLGWYTDATNGTKIESTTTVKITATQNLYAHWQAKTYTVNFNKNADDATLGTTSKTVTYDAQYGAGTGGWPTPERTGYTFLGWYTDATNGTKIESTTTVKITATQNLYAHWQLSTYTVTLNTNGGTVNSGNVTSYTYTQGATLPTNVTRTGYRFDGWFDNSGCTGSAVTSIATTATGTKEFWAKWTMVTYTVNFDKNAEDATLGTISSTVTYDAQYGAGTGGWPTPTRTNYTFVGWYTAATGGDKIESTTTVKITETQTLFAHWTATYYARAESNASPTAGGGTYISCNGNTPSQDSQYKAFDYSNRDYSNLESAPSCPAYYEAKQYDGYKFNGWYTEANGGGDLTSSNISYTEHFTVTAVTSSPRTTIVRYAYFVPVTVESVASNGAPTSNPLSFTKPESKTATVTFNVTNADATADFTKAVSGEGWEFVSWSYSNNQVSIVVRYTATATTTQGQHTATVTLTSKAQNGTSQEATVAANVNLAPSVSANKSTINFGSYNLVTSSTMSEAVTLTFNENATVYSKTADSDIAPFTTSWSADHKTLTVYFAPTEAGSWEKDLVVTVQNSQATPLSDTKTIHITGSAVRHTAAVTCNIANSYMVDDAALDLNALWTSPSSGAKSYSIVSFTPSGKNNEDATAPAITGNSLSLGQAGTLEIKMTQPQTTNYNKVETTKTITINKYTNALTCDWNSWSTNLATDDGAFVIFSSNNDATPITVTPATGTDIATYYADQHAVYTAANLGSATWTVAQAENYKYLAPESQTLTVNVITVTEGCYVYGPAFPDKEASKVGEINLPKAGAGNVLSFQMKQNFAGERAKLTVFDNNGNQLAEWYPEAESAWYYDNASKHTYTLPAGTKKINFQCPGSGYHALDDPYITNIRITRTEWISLQDIDGNTITSLDKMTNTIGGNSATATFYVDYSVCADEVRVASNNEHITVSPASFTPTANRQMITVTYTSAIPEDIATTIKVYTTGLNATLNLTAETEKQTPYLTWGSLYQGESVSLPVTFSDNAAATASNDAVVTYSVQEGEESIISVAADGRSFTIVGEGTAHLTATSAASTMWKSVSETKVITTTNKKIQNIVWNQSFTRGLKINDEPAMTAEVSVYDFAAGTEEVSAERTAQIQYTCPDANGVIEKIDATHFRVIGYGETTITASVAGNEEYEAASSVIKLVNVREAQTGVCDPALMTEITNEILFEAFSLGFPEVSHEVALDRSKGQPDKLSFYVRGVSYNLAIEYYAGGIDVYESTDGGASWSGILASVNPAKNSTAYSEQIQLSPDATNLRFVRAEGGMGYHYVGGINVTAIPELRVANEELNLGNIGCGATYNGNIGLSYFNVKGELSVAKENSTNGLNITDAIDAECGTTRSINVPFSVFPTEEGSWSNTVTITDELLHMSVEVHMTATVTKADQSIVWNPSLTVTGDNPPVLNATATSGLPVTYEITSGTNATIVNNEVVITGTGSFTITVSQAGNVSYHSTSSSKTFTVNPLTLILHSPTASNITTDQKLGDSQLSGGSAEDSEHNVVDGTWAWYDDVETTYAVGQHTPQVVFTPAENSGWYDNVITTVTLTVRNSQYIYTGEGAWENTANWSTGEKPTAEDNVIINGNVTINTVVEVNTMTIEQGSNVTLTVGGDLTVTNGTTLTREHYGNLHVEQEGKVQLNNGTLKVNDFILEAALGNTSSHAASGQVDDATHLNVNGAAYFQMSFDPDGAITYGWYDFVVPFEVDVLNGIYDDHYNKLTNGVHYLVMEHNEAKRAANTKDWSLFTGTMLPGRVYTITFDDAINWNTFVFKKKESTSIVGSNTFAAVCSANGENVNRGWNGLGNGTLQHKQLSASGKKVQLYDHTNNKYVTREADNYIFAVGTSFFVQVDAAQNISFTDATNRPILAPDRYGRTTDEFRLALTAENAEVADDHLWVSASEDATGEYVIGRDLLKMGTPTNAKVAQMWATRNNLTLCDAEVPLVGSKANVDIKLYTPKAGTYTIGIEAAPEDAELYMTLNGKIFWNLSMSPYTFDLTQGTTEGYGLRIMTRNQTTTDIEETEFSGQDSDVRKVLIDDVIYIVTPDGKMYDIVGKGVKF